MRAYRWGRRVLALAACASPLCSGFGSAVFAQVGSFGGVGGPDLTAPTVVTGRPDAFARPSVEYTALPVGDWLLYPTLFLGALYDTNVEQTPFGLRSPGGRLVPSLLAETTNGISKTTLYGMADGRLYTRGNGDSVSARAGAIENYQLLPDLNFYAQGDYTRQKDLFSTLGVDHSVTTINPTAVGLMPVRNPLSYNQFSGIGTVQKNFDRTFVGFGVSVVDQFYDHTGTGAPNPDGVTYTINGRGGFWLTPDVYTFADGSGDWRRYSTSTFNSSGYRAIAGFGTDRIGLFRGEVFGGYQSENHDFAGLGTVNGGVWGGRVHYYPLPELTVRAGLDQLLGVSFLAPSAGTPLGTSTKATTLLGEATYALSPEWAASGRAGYINTTYVSNPRRDDAWTFGTTVTYSVWRNFALTFDYQHTELSSNVAFQGFSRDVVTLGATYKY
jgi:hypothetical protein